MFEGLRRQVIQTFKLSTLKLSNSQTFPSNLSLKPSLQHMKILIIRFSSIGDIVLTTPVIRCLKKQIGAEVHFLCKRSFQAILKANPYLDKIHVIDKEVREVLPALRKEGFDYVIDLHRNLRSAQVKWGLRTQSFSFNKINWQKWLIVNFKINRLPSIHIVDRYLQTLTALGVQNDGMGLDYFIPPEEEVNLPVFFSSRGRTPTPYFAFVIGAAHQTKRLPVDRIVSICRRFTQTILLVGGPGEKEEGEQIARSVGEQVINTCGYLSLNESASLVRQAQAVVAHDTGFMHIAAAFRKPMVSIWGNTIPEFGMYPYYPKGLERSVCVEVKDLNCRPCSKIGFAKCPKTHFNCMNQIDESLIFEKTEQFFYKKKGK